MLWILLVANEALSQPGYIGIHTLPDNTELCDNMLNELNAKVQNGITRKALTENSDNFIPFEIQQSYIRWTARAIWDVTEEDGAKYNACIFKILNRYWNTPSVVEKESYLDLLDYLFISYQENANLTEGNFFMNAFGHTGEVLPYPTAAIVILMFLNARTPRAITKTVLDRVWNWIPNRPVLAGVSGVLGISGALGVSQEGLERLDAFTDGPRINPNLLIDYMLYLDAYNLGVEACDLKCDLELAQSGSACQMESEPISSDEDQDRIQSLENKYIQLLNKLQLLQHYSETKQFAITTEVITEVVIINENEVFATTEARALPNIWSDIEDELEKIDEDKEGNDDLLRDFMDDLGFITPRYNTCGGSHINLNKPKELLEEAYEILTDYLGE